MSGLIILILGLINKKKGMTILGSVFTFIAILIIVFGAFWGVRKTIRFGYNCKKELHIMRMSNSFNKHHKKFMNSFVMDTDSIKDIDSSGKVCIEKKIIINGDMKSCNPKGCKPGDCGSKSKAKCFHHK